jgi:hypothetical protein
MEEFDEPAVTRDNRVVNRKFSFLMLEYRRIHPLHYYHRAGMA